MAEELKVYGFCENKCRREVLSKEAADKKFDDIVITRMGNCYLKYENGKYYIGHDTDANVRTEV